MKPYRVSAPRPASEDTDTVPTLGVLKSHHAAPKSSRILALLAALGVAVPIAVVVATSRRGFDGFIVILVVFLSLVAGVIGWGVSPTKAVSVDLHEDGVAVLRRRRRVELCFDDVDELWFRVAVDEHHLVRRATLKGIRLVSSDKREVFIAATVESFDALLKKIDRACSYPLVAPAQAALQAGEPLTFGKVIIDRDSITVGRTRHEWSQLKLVRFQVDRVAFFVSQNVVPWRVVSWTDVPHPQLFFRLVKQLARTQEDDPGVRDGF